MNPCCSEAAALMLLELRNKLVLFDKLPKPFSRRTVLRLAEHYPRSYLALTLSLGLCGYLFLLLFPTLLVSMPVALFYALKPLMSAQDWFIVIVEVLLLLLGGVVSYVIFNMRFALPSGLELNQQNFPRLFELLAELRQEYGDARIDRVVLRDRFDVRIIKTPGNGFSFSTTHTLVIGLPVLLTMSPLDVHVLLARRVGQLAGQHSFVTSWLYSLRDMWAQYLADCGTGAVRRIRPVCGFFRYYIPLYRAVSVPLARNSELDADRYALQAMNDEDTARAITCQVLTEAYLSRTFWPNIIQTAKQSVKPDMLPHAQMAKLFAAGLPEDQIQAILRRVESKDSTPRSAMPGLSERLEHIGHRQPVLPKALAVTAARFYLGRACESCIELVDRRAQRKVRSKVIRECGAEAR
jgi:uncharacterized ParB-like nuclease family protein